MSVLLGMPDLMILEATEGNTGAQVLATFSVSFEQVFLRQMRHPDVFIFAALMG